MSGKIKRAVGYFMRRRKETQWNIYASHACFYALVSAVPLLMLALMVINRLMPARVEDFLLTVKDHLPVQISAYFPEEFVKNAVSAAPTMTAATLFVLFWSMSGCMRAIAAGLSSVYGVEEQKSALEKLFFPFLYAFVFFLLFLLALVVLVFGETILRVFEAQQSVHRHWIRLIVRLGWVAAFTLFALLFALCYRFLAGAKHRFYKHLPGAFFAAAGWVLYSALFSLYLRIFSPDRYIVYGSLGSVLILMLWARACMVILMLGGEVNVLLLDRPVLVRVRGGSETPPGENADAN